MKDLNKNRIIILSTFVIAIGLIVSLQLVSKRQVIENQAASNICQDNNASCEWDNQGSSVSYQFEIVDLSNGFVVKQGSTEVNQVNFTILPNHYYQCRVAAVNNCGKSAFSTAEKLCTVVLPTNTPTPIPTSTSTPVPTATLAPSLTPTLAPTNTPTPTVDRIGGIPTLVPTETSALNPTKTETLTSPYPTLDWNFDPKIEKESTIAAGLNPTLKEKEIISTKSASISSVEKKENKKAVEKVNSFNINIWTKVLSWTGILFVFGVILFGLWKKIHKS